MTVPSAFQIPKAENLPEKTFRYLPQKRPAGSASRQAWRLYFKEKYGVTDREVRQAVRYHTTGRPEMTLLEKIIYIADYIEPGRDKAPNLPTVRRLAFQDLDETMYVILKDTLEYLEHGSGTIDATTRQACRYYQELHDRRYTK